MKGKEKIALKTRLKRLGYKDSKINIILSSDEKLLEKLYLISNDKSLCESVDTIWNLYLTKKEENPQYLKYYQSKKILYKEEEYNDGLLLLNHLRGYKKRLVYQLLINDEVIKSKQSLEYAHLIVMAPNELLATIIYSVLINPYFNYLNVAKETAHLLLEPTSEEEKENLRNHLDDYQKELLFSKALKITQKSLRVFISSPEKEIRDNAKDIDNTLKEINLEIMKKEALKKN